MAKPRLEKVEALFYVLKQVAKGGCIRILIHPLLLYIEKTESVLILVFLGNC